MKLILSKSVIKELENLPHREIEKVYNHFKKLLSGASNLDIKKLRDSENYRLRIGNYRTIFSINQKQKTIEILDLLHRKDIYKKK